MAIHFVDKDAVGAADNNVGNQGHTLDLPWATLEWALESGALSAGDTIAVRRTHSEIPLSDIAPAYDGTRDNPITVFGCPRDAHAISSSDWTNGSRSVTVDDADMDREKHQARYITAPDGEIYFITRVENTTTIHLRRKYVGGTVSNDATASINADDVQATWEAYVDTADTIKKADWEADADDVPNMDFNGTSYNIYVVRPYCYNWFNYEIKDSIDTNGIIYIFLGKAWKFKNCLFKSGGNTPLLHPRDTSCYLTACTLEGTGAGTLQWGIYNQAGPLFLKDVALYNMGDFGIRNYEGQAFFSGVNLGIEIANGDEDINTGGEFMLFQGKDVSLGGSNGYITWDAEGLNQLNGLFIENYQDVLGEHKTFYPGGEYQRSAVSGETPNKKISDYVMKVSPNLNNLKESISAYPIMVHELDMTAAAHTLKYWIYNDLGVTINDGDAKADIWLKAEYIKAYDDTSKYVPAEIFSAENTILDAADADDWDSLSVTLTPAVASKVRLTIYISLYSAAAELFIDPAVVIT